MENKLVNHIRKMLDLDSDMIEIRVEFVENIPLDKSGKRMAVVSKIKAGL